MLDHDFGPHVDVTEGHASPLVDFDRLQRILGVGGQGGSTVLRSTAQPREAAIPVGGAVRGRLAPVARTRVARISGRAGPGAGGGGKPPAEQGLDEGDDAGHVDADDGEDALEADPVEVLGHVPA